MTVQSPTRPTGREATQPVVRARNGLKRGDTLPAVLGLGPAVTYMIALIGLPLLLVVYTSFTSVSISDPNVLGADFVGLANYQTLAQDYLYRTALRNSVAFTLSSELIKILLAVPLALLLMRNFRGRKIVRTLIILPYAVPAFIGALAWRWMLDSTYGLTDWLLVALNITDDPPVWLGEDRFAVASVIIVNIWHTLPLITVIVIAGLTSVPQELIDAAKVDGASAMRRLWHVMLPVMAPVVLVGQLFSFVFVFSELSIVYILTRGGPGAATEILPTAAFRTAIVNGQLGLGSAVGLLMVPVMALVAWLLLRFMGRGEEK